MPETQMPENAEKMAPENDGNMRTRLMSIREVSALTGVPPHTLRFWEKEMPDVLRPWRTPGGQRRYDAEMAERVRMIKRLSDEKRYSLVAIREQLGAIEGFSESRSETRKRIRTERAVELVVDEIANLLKERLLHVLEVAGPGGRDR